LYTNHKSKYSSRPYKVTHLNSVRESFKPFDIQIGNDVFLDVKTTRQYENSFFYISLSEAAFIAENFDNYLFGRVFPLRPNEKYYGIQIAGSWGVNFCRLTPSHWEEFKTAVNEIKNISQGEGFLIKTEWLMNISVTKIDDFSRLIIENRDFSKRHLLSHYLIDAGLTDQNLYKYFSTNNFQNYRVSKLIKLLCSAINERYTKASRHVLEKNGLSSIVKLWESVNLEKFIINCEYTDWNLIKRFITQLIILTPEKSVDDAILKAKILDVSFALVNNFPKSNQVFSNVPEINKIMENNANDIEVEIFRNPSLIPKRRRAKLIPFSNKVKALRQFLRMRIRCQK